LADQQYAISGLVDRHNADRPMPEVDHAVDSGLSVRAGYFVVIHLDPGVAVSDPAGILVPRV
jgi:hypothetical protein